MISSYFEEKGLPEQDDTLGEGRRSESMMNNEVNTSDLSQSYESEASRKTSFSFFTRLGAAAEPHLLRAPLCGHHQDGGEGRAGPGRGAAPEDVHRQDPDHAALDLLATG